MSNSFFKVSLIAILGIAFFSNKLMDVQASAQDILDNVRKGNVGDVQTMLEVKPELANAKLTADGATLMHMAAEKGHLDVVKLLVEKYNVNVEDADNWGCTAVHHAAAGWCFDVLEYLVNKCGANCNKLDSLGLSPLHIAVNLGFYEVVKFLVEECGASMYLKTKNGQNAFEYARDTKRVAIAAYLADKMSLPAGTILYQK